MPKVVVTDTKGLIQQTGTGLVINNNASGLPAYIVLTSANGTEYFLHVSDDGTKLLISEAIPDGNESSGGTDRSATFSP